jgi:hypothetical protein
LIKHANLYRSNLAPGCKYGRRADSYTIKVRNAAVVVGPNREIPPMQGLEASKRYWVVSAYNRRKGDIFELTPDRLDRVELGRATRRLRGDEGENERPSCKLARVHNIRPCDATCRLAARVCATLLGLANVCVATQLAPRRRGGKLRQRSLQGRAIQGFAPVVEGVYARNDNNDEKDGRRKTNIAAGRRAPPTKQLEAPRGVALRSVVIEMVV